MLWKYCKNIVDIASLFFQNSKIFFWQNLQEQNTSWLLLLSLCSIFFFFFKFYENLCSIWTQITFMLISHPYLITYSFKISIKQLIILIQINFETHYQTQTYLLKHIYIYIYIYRKNYSNVSLYSFSSVLLYIYIYI